MNKFPTIDIANVLAIDVREIVNLKSTINIRFEDGKVIEGCKPRYVIMYRILMEAIKDLPSFPIKSDTWIANFLSNGYFNYDTYTKLYSRLFRHLVGYVIKDKMDHNSSDIIEKFTKNIYKVINLIPDVLSKEIGEYVLDIEIMDILKFQLQENLLKSIVKVHKDPSQYNIEESYKEVDKVVNMADKKNVLKLIYLSKTINDNQFKQMLGSRGYLTEIDSKIYSIPYCNSFTLGAKNIYELAIESRAAAKALNFSNFAISESEHMARELQLVAMAIERVVPGDCGNNEYRDFYVKPKEIDPDTGKVIYGGDFKGLIGKYYFDTDLGIERCITPDMEDKLVGKSIKLRQAIKCKLANKKQICQKCFGDLYYSVFKHQNLGHICTTTITRAITQSLLSAKHLTKSADTVKITLRPTTLEYFTLDKDKLYLHKRFKNKKNNIVLYIPQNEVLSFKNIVELGDVTKINLSKASRLTKIFVAEYEDDVLVSNKEVEISSTNRKGMLTDNFWQYIIKKGYEVTDNSGNSKNLEVDYYVIDMSDYDVNKPIVRYEKKEFDFNAFQNTFKSLISTRKFYKDSETGRLVPEYTPEVLVEKIYELLNSKLSVNIALVEVLVYGFTAWDVNNRDYDLGRNSPNEDLIKLAHAIDYRSLGSALNWNNLERKLYDPMLFKSTNKLDHPLDVLLAPQQVVNYELNSKDGI